MGSFSVVSNIASVNAQANLQATNIGLQRTLTRLSSGYRINQSGDDAAGLAVANMYRNELAILNQGIRNANDGLSDLAMKDGAVGNIASILDRLATLATQAASSSNNANIAQLSAEYSALIEEIDRQATVAGLDTAYAFSVFVSQEPVAADGMVTGTIGAVDSATLGLATTTFATAADAQTALGEIETAVATVGDVQNTIGTLQNRLSFAISLATSQMVNTKAAESRIRDANMAEEAANLARYSILSQSGIAALAQANQSSAAVLALLR